MLHQVDRREARQAQRQVARQVPTVRNRTIQVRHQEAEIRTVHRQEEDKNNVSEINIQYIRRLKLG
jgi:hypothetical protein